MQTRSIVIGLLALLGGVLSSSCQDSPRDGAHLTSRTNTFSGYSQFANTTVQIQARDRGSNTWRTLATTTTQPLTTPSTDAIGYNWYAYARSVVIPAETRYWALTTTSGQRKISADVRSFTNQESALYTFDVSDEQCLEDNFAGGGSKMVMNCNAEADRDATVTLDCGKNGQTCCLAHGMNQSRFCDTGFICGHAYTCIPAGGIDQPCSINEAFPCDDGRDGVVTDCVNGPSLSTHALGMCRDVTIERTPILTAELAVRTCDSASAPTGASKYVELRSSSMYFLDHPGSDTVRNTTDHWGLVAPGISTLGDIDELSLGLFSSGTRAPDDWCFNRVDLIVNGRRVFRRDYPNGMWLGGSGPRSVRVANSEEMRIALLQNERDTHCSLPTELTYTQIQRMIEGALGDTFQRSVLETATSDGDPTANLEYDAAWGSPGFVRVSRLDATTARIHVRFRANNENMLDKSSNPLFELPEFAGTADVFLDANFSCSSRVTRTSATCTQNNCTIHECSSTFSNSIELYDADVDVDELFPLANVILPQVDALAEWIATDALRDVIGQQLDRFVSIEDLFNESEQLVCDSALNSPPFLAMCDTGGELCDCPDVTVGSTAVSLGWTNFGVPRLDLVAETEDFFPMCR